MKRNRKINLQKGMKELHKKTHFPSVCEERVLSKELVKKHANVKKIIYRVGEKKYDYG